MEDRGSLLARRCQSLPPADREATYRELYDVLEDDVRAVCFRMTGNAADALDATQQAFAIVFRRLDDFRFESRLSTWAVRIAFNCCIDQLRRRRRHAARDDELDGEPPELDERTPDEAAEVSELALHVHRGIRRLSPKLRQILVLRHLQGLSYPELAGCLGLSTGTVKSRLARARAALARELEWLRGDPTEERAPRRAG